MTRPRRPGFPGPWLCCFLAVSAGLLLFPGLAWGQAADTVPADTVPADTVSVDTVQADTVPADSLAADSVDVELEPTTLERARAVVDTLMQNRDSLALAMDEMPGLGEAAAQVRRVQAIGYLNQTVRLEPEAVELLLELEGDEEEAPIRADFLDVLRWMDQAYQESARRNQSIQDSVRALNATAPPEERPRLASELRLRRAQVDTIFMGRASILTNAEQLGLDVEEPWRALEGELLARADGLVGLLQVAQLERSDLQTELADSRRAGISDSELTRLRTEIQTVTRRIQELASSLERTADFLDGRGYNTAPYRQLVIQATGEVTGDILNMEVLRGLLSDFFRSVADWIEQNGPTVLVRFLIVLACIGLTRIAVRFAWWSFQFLGRVRLPRLAKDLLGRMLMPVATILGVGVGLAAIGVDTTTVLAGAGVLGVVVGFALQDSLANLAAGFFILLYRPYDVDDVIEAAGVVGRVRTMGLANTTVLTFDNRKLSIPNSKLWGNIIANRTSEPTRRSEAVMRIGLGENVSRVQEVVLQTLSAHELVLDDPAPSSYVSEAEASWLELKVWAWSRNEDWWTITSTLPAILKAAFEDAGIEIPLPRQEVLGLSDGPRPAPPASPALGESAP